MIMIERYREIQRRRAAGELDVQGFTLIELLIVIVVLGILAAVVVFALGGVTSQSAVSACNADAKTVEVAVAAYQANNGTNLPLGAAGQTALLAAANGGPYLQTFPSNSGANYTITIDGAVANQVDVKIGGGTAAAYTQSSCATAT